MNMTYCRFQNTLTDLRDCYNAMDELQNEHGELDSEGVRDELSEEEFQAMESMLEVARNLTQEFQL